MIQISDLNKTYSSKKKKKCHALKNVNLTFPDAGLVFVLGKSGSGKSTLLNLIGGLDNVTSGNIVVNGNDLSKLSEKDFCNYRNDHIGFIFQDYHLINDLTVYENIAISLRLKNDTDEASRVAMALERVGLAGYETRYPQELSGGEQQRVAVARALVKRPQVILADEPTGNLDTMTARAVMEILKELSRDCLILIVSHNILDAHTYADRIVELAHGEVISDKEKNADFPDTLTVSDDALLYPENTVLADEDIGLINANQDKKIVKINDKFMKTKPPVANEKQIPISDKKLGLSHKIGLSAKFLKNKGFSIILSSFMIAAIMVIMALAQTIITFNGNAMIESEIKKANINSLYLKKDFPQEIKNSLDTSYRSEIDETDVQGIKDSGYKGDVYPVYNATVPITTYGNASGFTHKPFSETLFIRESLGTMIVDETFFEEKFGAVDYVARLDNYKTDGLIITDYLADCILSSNRNYLRKTYEDILGDYVPSGWTRDSLRISAIVKTGYRDKHQDVFDKLKNGEASYLKELYNDPEFLSFTSDVYDSLGFSFSLDENFCRDAYANRDFFSTAKLVFNDIHEYHPTSAAIISFIDVPGATELKEGEVSMSLAKYNDIFKTHYDTESAKDFVPHKVKISSYKLYDMNNEEPLYTIEVTIANLHSYSDVIIFNPENSEDYRKTVGTADTYPYALYLLGSDGVEEIVDPIYDLNYSIEGHTIDGIRTMTRAVEVFIPIFELMATILCTGAVLIVLNFASKMITDKMHDIGILKALGAKNGTISTVFGLQVLLIALLTSLMSTIGYFVFIDLANTVLFESLKRLAPLNVVLDLDFLTFKPLIAAFNCVAIFCLSLFALLLPLIKIKLIKPVKIIKARD